MAIVVLPFEAVVPKPTNATFVWDAAVQWPPPAHILQNYDVVSPAGVSASTRSSRPTRGANQMAAVEITISGVLYDKYNRTQQNVVLFGEASITGLGVGGGPIIPGAPPSSPGHPQFPINLPPGSGWLPGGRGAPGGYPPMVGGGPIIPPPPTEPPTNPSEPKPPPPDGGWGWHPEYGWGYFPMTGGKPQPPG